MRRDAVSLAADYAEDCVVESPAWGKLKGRDAVEKVFRAFFAAFPDCLFEFGEFLFVENKIIGTVTMQGTDTGGFLGQPATGQPFRLFLVDLLTVDHQRIVHERRVYDVGGLMSQLASGSAGAEAAQLYKVTLERAQAEHEMRTAAEIQRALMPLASRKGIGFEVVATSRPCRAIGGDFIDYFNLSDGAFAFVLGDVAEKRTGSGAAGRSAAGSLHSQRPSRRRTSEPDSRSQRRARSSRDRIPFCYCSVRRAHTYWPFDVLQRRTQSPSARKDTRHTTPGGRGDGCRNVRAGDVR